MTVDRIVNELDAARRRTTALLEPLDEAALLGQHSPIMSPLVWDLAHVANYEDLWLLRALGDDGVGSRYDEIYDAFRHARRDRPNLDLLDPVAARRYGDDVRARALDLLAAADLERDGALRRDGFVYGMVAQHEQQHDETMLATLQLMAGGYRPLAPAAPRAPGGVAEALSRAEVVVPGGAFLMGTSADAWSLDNERPCHEVDVATFAIDAAPVTNAAYAGFVADGGYDRPELWHPDGWRWKVEQAVVAPMTWQRDGDSDGTWTRDRFGFVESLPAHEPVQHVCWYEADAYARWIGKRLPTEAEWEKAATWDSALGVKRRFPWGDDEPTSAHANLDGAHFGPSEVGAHPEGASPAGCHQLIGDVWEWTASDFSAYPGFEVFPYREYSEVFFGPGHKVLRGGSWATAPVAIRGTFRNWDLPIRRQIFTGFRCARDA